jgi:hypothetical protein
MTQEGKEELGICVGCNEPIQVGEVVTAWDDEIGHYNCTYTSPTALIGYPARSVPLGSIIYNLQPHTKAQQEREAIVALLRNEGSKLYKSFLATNSPDTAAFYGVLLDWVDQLRKSIERGDHRKETT